MNNVKHSTGKMVSFTSVIFGTTIVTNIMTARFTAFYETEILLPINLMVLAIIFYTIWDMINDPIFGHLTDRKYRLTRRWGKRFPWLMCASFPVIIILIFFFMPPDPSVSGVWLTLVWFLIFLMLFDGSMTIIGVSYLASLINKFRSDEERLKVSSYQQLLSTLGLMLAFFIPPLVVQYGNKSSYIMLAIICGVIFLITILLSIPGQRESKEEIDKYYITETKQEPFLKSFIRMLKTSLKQKNFRALLVMTITLALFNLLFIASIPCTPSKCHHRTFTISSLFVSSLHPNSIILLDIQEVWSLKDVYYFLISKSNSFIPHDNILYEFSCHTHPCGNNGSFSRNK